MGKIEATVEEIGSMIDYPTVTFPVLKKNEIAKHGEYRTQRLILEAWDRLEMDSLSRTDSSQSPRKP